MAKQDDYVRYTIRVPADLYARIQSAAGPKSVNAEIVEALEARYPQPIDGNEFADKWLVPILDAKDDHERADRLFAAQKAAKRINEKMSVSTSWRGGDLEVTLGFPDGNPGGADYYYRLRGRPAR